MLLTQIINRITTEYENVREVEVGGDYFFMYQDEEKFPFATIVSSDNEFDSISNTVVTDFKGLISALIR